MAIREQGERTPSPEHQPLLATERRVVVAYWTDALTSPFVSNARDVKQAQRARQFAEVLPPVTEEQAHQFAVSLASRLAESISNLSSYRSEDLARGLDRLSVGVTLRPDPILTEAAEEAGIDALSLRFPHQTRTYLRKGEVTVYREMDEREQRIYPFKEPPATG